jgi:hypothetical protein
MANLLFGQTSGGHDVLWFQERLGGSAANSDSSEAPFNCSPRPYDLVWLPRNRHPTIRP